MTSHLEGLLSTIIKCNPCQISSERPNRSTCKSTPPPPSPPNNPKCEIVKINYESLSRPPSVVSNQVVIPLPSQAEVNIQAVVPSRTVVPSEAVVPIQAVVLFQLPRALPGSHFVTLSIGPMRAPSSWRAPIKTSGQVEPDQNSQRIQGNTSGA